MPTDLPSTRDDPTVTAAVAMPVPAAAPASDVPRRDERPYESLGANPDFRTFVVAQGVSALGDAVSFTALPLLVFALTGSGLAMGVVGALQTLPDLLFGLVAGAIADRSDQKRMMVLTDFGRAILTALIPLSVLLGGPTMAVILIVAAPMSTLRSLFLAAYTAAVPAIVGRPRLAQANSYFEVVYSTGFIIGPAVAGLLSAAIGPGLTMGIDAASFALAATGVALIRQPLRAPGDRPESHLTAEIREGIEFIVHHPVLRSSILFWGITSVVSAGLVAALTVRITRDLALPASALGVVLATFGIGTVIGALWASRLRRGRAWPQIIGGNLVRGAALLGVALAPSVEVMSGLAFAAGVASSLVLLAYITVRSAYAPDELLGRVGSTARTLSLGMQPLGMLATGIVIDATTGSTTLVGIAIALIATSVVFLPSRALRSASLDGR